MQGRRSSKNEAETPSQGTSKIEQSQWSWGNFPPKLRPRTMLLKMLQWKGGLSHHPSVCLDASSAASQVRHHPHLVGRWPRRQRVTNLCLHPGRDLSASSYIRTGGRSCGLSREQHFGLRNAPAEGAKIYLQSSPRTSLT